MADRVRRATKPAFESAVDLLPETLRGRLQHWRGALLDQTNGHPARTIALALGAGYVVGGGLFSALTGRIVATGVRLGLRLAVVPFMSQSIAVLGRHLLPRNADAGAQDDAVSAAEEVSPKKSGSQNRSSSRA